MSQTFLEKYEVIDTESGDVYVFYSRMEASLRHAELQREGSGTWVLTKTTALINDSTNTEENT